MPPFCRTASNVIKHSSFLNQPVLVQDIVLCATTGPIFVSFLLFPFEVACQLDDQHAVAARNHDTHFYMQYFVECCYSRGFVHVDDIK